MRYIICNTYTNRFTYDLLKRFQIFHHSWCGRYLGPVVTRGTTWRAIQARSAQIRLTNEERDIHGGPLSLDNMHSTSQEKGGEKMRASAKSKPAPNLGRQFRPPTTSALETRPRASIHSIALLWSLQLPSGVRWQLKQYIHCNGNGPRGRAKEKMYPGRHFPIVYKHVMVVYTAPLLSAGSPKRGVGDCTKRRGGDSGRPK